MKMKKRIIQKALNIIMVSVLAINLIACGNEKTGDVAADKTEVVETGADATSSENTAASDEQTVKTTAEPEKQDTAVENGAEQSSAVEETPTEKVYQIKEFEIPDTEAYRFLRDMKVGWNLGNCFDASDCTWLSDEMDYETGWCGAKATQELITELKNAGFNTIRIPVSWHNHLTDEKNYTISENWLNRVNEVVDYCYEEDMYVILNIHHDNSESYMYPTSQYLNQSKKYIRCIWTQLSERFKDYDEKLLFACMNEPRMVGSNYEWWIDKNNNECKDAIACVNEINQEFVNTVRASGGNNGTRYLICPGYDASIDGIMNDGFQLPTDPNGGDRLIVSLHAYTPYDFALNTSGTDKWSSDKSSDISNMVGFMNDAYKKFVANGIPIIIDEFGAVEKKGNIEARADFAGCYVANARARGLTCIWWDNNVAKGNGERLGIINRKTLKWDYPEIRDAIIKYCE